MVVCKYCKKTFATITPSHVKKHGFNSIKEYLERYPEAPLKDSIKSDVPRKRGVRIRGGADLTSILLYDTDGTKKAVVGIHKTDFEWFKKFRDTYHWSNRLALKALLALWYENIDSENVNRIVARTEGGENIKELHVNAQKEHRATLEELIRDLEGKIKQEADPGRLSQQIKNLAEVHKIQLELEKSYQTNTDDRIQTIVENRKAICKNILPTLFKEGVKHDY